MNGLKTINSNVLMDINWTLTPTYKVKLFMEHFVVVIIIILILGQKLIIIYYSIFIKIIKINLTILMLFH